MSLVNHSEFGVQAGKIVYKQSTDLSAGMDFKTISILESCRMSNKSPFKVMSNHFRISYGALNSILNNDTCLPGSFN